MPLYLVRHAHAVSEEENSQRPLSERGRAQVRTLATWFRRNGLFTPSQVWHSPLARARETAELLLIGLASEPALVETAGLRPEDDPQVIASRLNALTSAINVALVGHEPQLSALATLLIRGKPAAPIFELKKGAVLVLERTKNIHPKTGLPRWTACWHITPELLQEKPAAAEMDL
jgi:phosphohistidine phosphatase